MARLGLRGAGAQLAQHCTLLRRQDERFELTVDARSRALLTPSAQQALIDALSALIGRPARVDFAGLEANGHTPAQLTARAVASQQAQARAALESDPLVRDLIATLDARVIDGSAAAGE